jgi:hypothetical protein
MSNDIKGTYLCWFLLMFFIINTLKMGAKQKGWPQLTIGYDISNESEALNNLTEHFVWGFNIAFKLSKD